MCISDDNRNISAKVVQNIIPEGSLKKETRKIINLKGE